MSNDDTTDSEIKMLSLSSDDYSTRPGREEPLVEEKTGEKTTVSFDDTGRDIGRCMQCIHVFYSIHIYVKHIIMYVVLRKYFFKVFL